MISRAVAAGIAGVVIAVGLGLWLHSVDRTTGESWHSIGAGSPDRVDVYATVQRVDAAAREVVLRVLVIPRGRLGEDDGSAPAGELRLLTSSSLRGDQLLPAHQRIAGSDLPVPLSGGPVTDYPFDGYRTHVEFAALYNGEPVPVLLTLVATAIASARKVIIMNRAKTSTAVERVRWRSSPLSPPGATPTAKRLSSLSTPGSPPLGSLLDYTAFLWAEVVIALTVVVAVLTGAVVERRR
nr:DUF4436 family protein [Amycolatopsis sp. GM8]